MNYVLIGFMGSGKTTIGIRMSYHAKQPFLDTDKEIERRSGRKIPEIFETDGEAAFRQMENDYVRSLLDKGLKDHVISTGGGLATNPDNWEPLKKLGVLRQCLDFCKHIHRQCMHSVVRYGYAQPV